MALGTPGRAVTFTVIPHSSRIYTRQPSCDIATAPRLPLRVPQLAAGYLCPGGRQYFKLDVRRARTKMVFTWANDNFDEGYSYGRSMLSIYKPGTNLFNADHAHSQCGGYSSDRQETAVCSFKRRGRYVVAVDSAQLRITARLKHTAPVK
jgi:hypothetical protein